MIIPCNLQWISLSISMIQRSYTTDSACFPDTEKRCNATKENVPKSRCALSAVHDKYIYVHRRFLCTDSIPTKGKFSTTYNCTVPSYHLCYQNFAFVVALFCTDLLCPLIPRISCFGTTYPVFCANSHSNPLCPVCSIMT